MSAYVRISPESPRLLLTQGKVERAEGIIRHIKTVNKQKIPGDFRKELEKISSEISGEEAAGILTLMSSMRMVNITVLFAITW